VHKSDFVNTYIRRFVVFDSMFMILSVMTFSRTYCQNTFSATSQRKGENMSLLALECLSVRPRRKNHQRNVGGILYCGNLLKLVDTLHFV
jgi:hypothetical protein